MRTIFIVFVMLSSAAQAAVVRYSYSGADFDQFGGGLPAGLTAMSGYIDIDGGLLANSVNDMSLLSGNQGVIADYYFTDGVTDMTAWAAPSSFTFTTDVAGNITDWAVIIDDSEGMVGHYFRMNLRSTPAPVSLGFDPIYDQVNYAFSGDGGPAICVGLTCSPATTTYVASSAAGTWAATTLVPIPAAIWLFGSALASIGWLVRRRPA